MNRSLIILGVACATLSLPAQTTKPAEKPSAHSQTAPEAPPQLTEEQKLKLENIQLKASLVQQQLKELQGEYSTTVQQIVAEHPGFTWNPQTNSLVAAPTKK